MPNLTGLLGVLAFLFIAYVLSSSRRSINWRIVISGLLLQALIAGVLLQFEPVVNAFDFFAQVVTAIIGCADKGITFLFGSLGHPDPTKYPWGFVFAFRVLPVIIFFASFMAVLYHLGIMQRVVAGVAWLLRRTLGITGVEALSAAANIFVGQTEAPLTVKPYIAGMTQSQLMAIMVGGFATIAGSVMAAYIGLLGGPDPAAQVLFAKHLITASVMSAPAGLVMAKIMLPETEVPRPESVSALLTDDRTTRNVVDAAASGATDGLRLAANVAAMLVAFVALLALINLPLTLLSDWKPILDWRIANGIPPISLETILGFILTPIAWLIGVGSHDAQNVGSLLGVQVIATEFVAYLNLADHIKHATLDPRSAQIAAYCLCGFANVASIGIQIGGLSAMAPERRSDLARLAPRAMLAGALACWMTGAIAGVFIVK